jgi:hypothetical protein
VLLPAERATTQGISAAYGWEQNGSRLYLISDCLRFEGGCNRSSTCAATMKIGVCRGRSEECTMCLTSSVRGKSARAEMTALPRRIAWRSRNCRAQCKSCSGMKRDGRSLKSCLAGRRAVDSNGFDLISKVPRDRVCPTRHRTVAWHHRHGGTVCDPSLTPSMRRPRLVDWWHPSFQAKVMSAHTLDCRAEPMSSSGSPSR